MESWRPCTTKKKTACAPIAVGSSVRSVLGRVLGGLLAGKEVVVDETKKGGPMAVVLRYDL